MEESLLCYEDWLISPNENDDDEGCNAEESNSISKDDFEETFRIFSNKDTSFMSERGYLEFLKLNKLIHNARTKSANWLLKTQRLMNLSNATVFGAVNYLDRFISRTNCQGWKDEKFELLSIASLSVASKFNETIPPRLHDYQGLDHSFESSLIQKMELRLLQALEWRMDCITPFSYIELLVQIINPNKQSLVEDLISRATNLLLNTLLDYKLFEIQPCVIAISVVQCIYEDLCPTTTSNDPIRSLSSMIPQDQKDDLIKCQKIVEELLERDQRICENSLHNPSSPVTVLNAPWYSFEDCRIDISGRKLAVIEIGSRSCWKRKRDGLK